MVIGGGIAGLATAALLAREGYRVSLLEARSSVGGRAGSWEHEGFRFDTGPSWYLMPGVFDHFYRLLGTSSAEQLRLRKLDPGYRVFFEKHDDPVDIVSDLDANIETFERIEAGAGAALRSYLASASDTFDLAVTSFLYGTFASFRPLLKSPVLQRGGRLARLLVQSLQGFIARSFTDTRLRQILGYPAVFLGSSPALTPSLYHLMSHLDLEDGVYYPHGGFTEVITSVERLAKAEGAEIVTQARVSAITTTHTGPPRVTGVHYTGSDGVSRHLAADLVVSAADLHHTENDLLPENLRSYPERWWSKKVAGPGAVLLYLGVRGALPQLAHHSLFFTEDWADNFGRIFNKPTSIPSPASLYVCRPSASDSTVAPADHENIFVLVPVPADPRIGRGGDDGQGDPRVEEVAEEAIRQISEWAGIPDLAERIVVRRTVGPGDFAHEFQSWKGSALGPAHTLRQSSFLRGKNISSRVHGLLYAGGTTVPGIGLPMCLISAELIIKRLRGDVSVSALPEPL